MIRCLLIQVLFYIFAAAQETSSQRIAGDISNQKCKEYAKYATEGTLATNSGQKCSYTTLVTVKPTLDRRQFAHIAAVGFEDNDKIFWACGGTLISENYVLTAGHCSRHPVTKKVPKYVLLGVTSLDEESNNRQQIEIDRVIVHPEYKTRDLYNDLGLLKLKNPAKLDVFTHPACLNTKSEVNTGKVEFAAFASTDAFETQSRDLQKVTLDIFSKEECNSNYQNITQLNKGIVDSHICAGPRNGGKDLCRGSGGSPLIVPHDGRSDKIDCMNDIVGVVSFGKACGIADSPTISTRVSKYIKWIEDTIWPNN